MKESFNRGFDKKFIESCRSETQKRGADPRVGEKYCDCALEKFKEHYSTEEAGKFCAAKVRAEMHLGSNP